MRYHEIGSRLKAFRMASDLSAEEIARRIGISRTALYRFERGELAKIETLEKLAELLNVSIPTLLGVGIEYFSSSVAYFERLRQCEEQAQQIVGVAGPISYLLATDNFAALLEQLLLESIASFDDSKKARKDVGVILDILRQRRESYRKRKPSIIFILSSLDVERILQNGFIGKTELPFAEVQKRIALARAEIAHLADLVEQPPMGVQIGVVAGVLPQAGFHIFRHVDKNVLSISPFRLAENPNVRVGVAMITSAPEALTLHEHTLDRIWKVALKGTDASNHLRKQIEAAERGTNIRTLAAKRPVAMKGD